MQIRRVVYWLAIAVLAAPALVLTLVRLTDLDVGTAIRIEAFTPLGVPLWTALVILLLLGSLLRRHGARTRRLAATLVAMVGLGLHLYWFAPQILGANPAPAPGARTLTIMNANLYVGQADADQLVAAVRRDHVDLLVTEEITPTELDRLHAAGLSDLLPHEAGRADPEVSGTMVFADQPISDVVDLHTQFQSYRVSVGGLTVIAAHPLSPEFPSGWRADHALIRRAATSARVDLIVGDLNATPDHTVMRALGNAGYRDVGELANEGWQPTWPANHLGVVPFLPPTVRIDHVLVASTLAAIGTHTVHLDDTDHLALVAQVALR